MASTYFTKLSSSEFFALIGGEVGASAFLPLVARTAPPIVTLRVAMASCECLELAMPFFRALQRSLGLGG
jgi:hypothetical protein